MAGPAHRRFAAFRVRFPACLDMWNALKAEIKPPGTRRVPGGCLYRWNAVCSAMSARYSFMLSSFSYTIRRLASIDAWWL